jgi:hypothetical protein
MNKVKLQTDVLKAMLTGGEVIHAKMKNGLIALGSKYFCCFLPDYKVKVRLEGDGYTRLQKMIDDRDLVHYEIAKQMYTIEHTMENRKKIKVVKLQTVSGRIAFVDQVYLKYFDKDARFFVIGPRQFVCVYESDPLTDEDILAGIIFPVIVNIEGV